jgi:hypothetical protein
LARIGVTRPFEQVEAFGQPVEQLSGREECGPRRCELECEREVIEPFAELGNLPVRAEPGIE